jgi:hypothetical protein
MRAAAIALAILVLSACGKYGPPVRTAPEPAAAAAPAGADTEQCDPNAPANGAEP